MCECGARSMGAMPPTASPPRSRLGAVLLPHGWHREDVETAGVMVAVGTLLTVVGVGDTWFDPVWSPILGAVVMLLLGGLGIALGPNLRTALVCFALALAVDALGGLHDFSLWLIFQAVFAVVSHAPKGISVVVVRAALVLVVAACLIALIAGNGVRDSMQVGLMVAGVLFIPSLWASNVREHRALARTERERADAQAEAGRLAQAAAADRAHLEVERARAAAARDLHDLVASHVSAIALQSQAATLTSDEGRRTEILRTVHTSAGLALGELRRMIDVMRGDDASATTSVRDTLRLAQASGVKISGEEVLLGLSPAREEQLRPVIAEVMANVLHHAKRPELTISAENGGLRLSNPAHAGRPFLAAPGPASARDSLGHVARDAQADAPRPHASGQGLRNMATRLEAIGGRAESGYADGAWTLTLTLPPESGQGGAALDAAAPKETP